MAMPEGLRIGLGTEYIGRTRINVVQKPEQARPNRGPASSVARHEIEHAVTAVVNGTPVESVTIIPGPGYNGLTKLSRFDPIAAVAPFANGRSGTSHDIFITKLSGHNPEALSGIARSITDKNRPHIEEVALTLDEKKTLGGSEIVNIMNRVEKEKNKPPVKKADIYITNPDGTEWNATNVTLTPEGTVRPIDMSPGLWVYPGKQAASG